MILHSKQAAFLKDDSPILLFCGGVGAGKTVAGSVFAIKMIYERPAEIGVIFTNTHRQLSQATLFRFMEVLEAFGLIRGIHYIIDRNPESVFGYKSKFPDHAGIWSFRNGAQILTFSLESQMRGIEVGYCWGDEVQDAKIEELNVVLGRVRGSDKPLIRYTMTPPAYNPEVRELIYGKYHLPKVIATTYDNQAHLPPGFIDILKTSYNQLTFDREVLAKDVQMTTNQWFFAMQNEDVVKKIFTDSPIERVAGYPVILSFDFNKDPLTCLAIQRWTNKVRIMKEYRLERSNLDNICQRIRHDYGISNYYITGDFTGKYGDSIVQSKFMNYYKKICILLRVSDSRVVLTPNILHVNSREQCNSVLENHPDLLISKKDCPYFVDDLMYLSSTEEGKIDKTKDKRRSHLSDCFRYFCANFEKEYLKKTSIDIINEIRESEGYEPTNEPTNGHANPFERKSVRV